MQEDHKHLPSSSHAVILKAVTYASHASSANGENIENPLPPTTRSRYMTVEIDEPKPRPDMVTCFRRLYMPEQFRDAGTTIQQTQDQYAIKNMHI